MTNQNSKCDNQERRLDNDLLKKGLRCDLDQYEFLKRCSDKKDMTEWNQWLNKHLNVDIFLEGTFFKEFYLKDVELWYSHLKKAVFSHADLRNAKLGFARLEGAEFKFVKMQGSNFHFCIVDGETLFLECKIDRHTWFYCVGLDNVRIDPATKQLLEYNIRRKNWVIWYKEHPSLKWIVKPFWWVSDYGISTGRIVATFFVAAIFFAAIYSNLNYWYPPGIVSNLEVEPHLPIWHYFVLILIRPVYLSIVTMTIGFGNMNASAQSILGHILVGLQVVLGYVLLAALVTRLAVLFTAGGPAGRFADEKTLWQRLKELWNKIKKK